MEREVIKYRLKELEKNRDKYYNVYQQAGSASAMRTFGKYDDLCDICYEALKSCDTEDAERTTRLKNFNAFINRYKETANYAPGKTYTTQEVVEILGKAKGLV